MAQPAFKLQDSAFVKTIDALPAMEPFDTAHKYHRVNTPYIYLVSQNEVYSLLGYNYAAQYRNFNFNEYHILGRKECRQCFLFCHHDEGQTGCHRNRCSDVWIWTMRENSKAFVEVPVITYPASSDKQNDNGLFFRKDTIMRLAIDSALVNWYTTGRGDCHARFEYRLFTDRYYPVLLLKEWKYSGGCRAAGSKPAIIGFTMPEGISFNKKATIFVD